MNKKLFNKSFFICFAAVLVMTSLTAAQIKKVKTANSINYNNDSPDEKLKRLSIRLEVEGSSAENNSAFVIGKDKQVIIRVLASVSDQRTIGLGYADKPGRFKLIMLGNDNTALPYPAATEERLKREWKEIERRKSPDAIVRYSGPSLFITPNRENVIDRLNLADWYGKPAPGIYRIKVLFGFGDNENENKIQSEIITLKIVSE